MSKQFETTHWDADKVRSQGEKSAQNHRRRKNKKFNWGIYIACVVLGSVVLASLGWLLANDLCSLNKKDVTVTIEVTEGETLGQVARQLKQEGLINYKWFFKLYANITGDKKLIDPGSYELTSDMDYRALIRGMHDYEAAKLKQEGKVKVTIPEGYTVQETIELLASKGVGTVEELTEIKTAVSEAVSNSIIHGYRDCEDRTAAKVSMECAMYDGGKIVITVEDQGIGIKDVKQAMEPMFSTGDSEERSGMGFTVMESFTDKLKVRSEEGRGTTVIMIKYLDVVSGI